MLLVLLVVGACGGGEGGDGARPTISPTRTRTATLSQELRASGETSRQRIPEARDNLTPQELQIARLAAKGLSNREIAQQLYLSPIAHERIECWETGSAGSKSRLTCSYASACRASPSSATPSTSWLTASRKVAPIGVAILLTSAVSVVACSVSPWSAASIA